ERVEPVVLALREWVEFVVVALRAPKGEPKECRAGGVHAIDHRLDAKLLWVNAALLVDLRIAMEAGGNLLFESRLREQVARELVDGELVEGQVAIERVDDPIAVFPD